MRVDAKADVDAFPSLTFPSLVAIAAPSSWLLGRKYRKLLVSRLARVLPEQMSKQIQP